MPIPLEERVISLTDEDLSWGFNGCGPSYYLKTKNSKYGHSVSVDPFPCYAPDRDLVIKVARDIESKFPIGLDVFYFLGNHENVDRCNGFAAQNTIWDDDKKVGEQYAFDCIIWLSGKRIPIFPKFLEGLCWHEFGHCVDNYLCYKRGLPQDELNEEYAKMRGVELFNDYGGRKWHKNIGEIIANDFKIIVGNSGPDYFPHDVEHPNNVPAAKRWWYEQMLKYAKG